MHVGQLLEKVSERISPSLIDYFNPIIKKAKKISIWYGVTLAAAIGITPLLPNIFLPAMFFLLIYFIVFTWCQFYWFLNLKKLSSQIKKGNLSQIVDKGFLENIPLSFKELTSEEVQQLFKLNFNIDAMKILSDAIKANGAITYSELFHIYQNQSTNTESEKMTEFAQKYACDKTMQNILELNGFAVHKQQFNSKHVL